MNDNELRTVFHKAFGEERAPQALANRIRDSLDTTEHVRRAPILAAAIAGILAVAVVAGMIGTTRLLAKHDQPATSARAYGTPTPSASLPCRLPIVVVDASAQVGANSARPDVVRYTAGFVSLPDGRFTPDPSAEPNGLPFDQMYAHAVWRPYTYDWVDHIWLSVSPGQVSPDHGKYVYGMLSPENGGVNTEVHVFDILSRQDRILANVADVLSFSSWASDGIYATGAMRQASTDVRYYRIDFETATVAVIAPAEMKPYPNPAQTPFPPSQHVALHGRDARGRWIASEGSSTTGGTVTYYLWDGNAKLPMYSGPAGPGGFDATSFQSDGDRLWTVSGDGSIAWLWTFSGGLQRFPVQDPPRSSPYITVRVAGPCRQ